MTSAVPHPSLSTPRNLLLHTLAVATLALLGACGGSGGGADTTAAADDTSVATNPVDAPAPAPATSGTTPSGGTDASATAVPAGLQWRGVNLSGAEYNGTALPGRYGYQYFYPSTSAIDYFQAKGMNLVRLPFLWERVQPTLYASLDPTELQRLKDFVAAATAKGVTVLIDPHNYGRYRQQVVGSTGVPHTAFGDFWSRLSNTFKANPKVIFGLMNEPYGMSTENWVGAANEAIRRIRATGATNVIAVPGNAWSG
jgi:endoglucanase